MQDFFVEKRIEITGDSGDAITVYMRPLKVSELPRLFRIEGMIAREEEVFDALIELIGRTIDCDIDDLPLETLDGLIDTFKEFNFGGGNDDRSSNGRNKPPSQTDSAMVIEAMISQGHALSEIKRYTLPQFMAIQEAMANRLSGKQKPVTANPIDVLSSIGVKVRNNGQ